MPFTLPFTATEITAFKDIALAISALTTASAAVATATFAYKGLNKWKSEARFQDRFQLAKEIVETTYKASEVSSRLSAPIHLLHARTLAVRLPEQKISPLNVYKDKLSSLHIQARALYGEEQSKPIESYIRVIDDLLDSCQIFIDNYDRIRELDAEIKMSTTVETEQVNAELVLFTERMNKSKYYIVRKPSLEKLKGLTDFALTFEQELLNSPSKDDIAGMLYDSEQQALDELVKSMQSYLGD